MGYNELNLYSLRYSVGNFGHYSFWQHLYKNCQIAALLFLFIYFLKLKITICLSWLWDFYLYSQENAPSIFRWLDITWPHFLPVACQIRQDIYGSTDFHIEILLCICISNFPDELRDTAMLQHKHKLTDMVKINMFKILIWLIHH